MRSLHTPACDLQAVWDVLYRAKESDAMLTPTREAGVFVGIQQMEYGGLAAPYLTAVGPYSATGTPFSVAAGRISFSFGLKGAAVSHPHSLLLLSQSNDHVISTLRFISVCCYLIYDILKMLISSSTLTMTF